ncbi:MAG: sigma 54-interacting transcriptional regulator [Myxococcaceae bacterium]
MRAQDLDLRELLDFDPNGGPIRFAGQRAILLDAVAMGILREQLIKRFGFTAARGLLTQFGFAHGWRTAEVMKTHFPWDNEQEWKTAGGRLHRLQGLVTFEPVARKATDPQPFADSIWKDSYEAEQHLLMFGQSTEPVCWTLCGFASGYLSYCNGREVFCVETRCVAKGDAVCMMEGRFKEDWGEQLSGIEPHFKNNCLEQEMNQVTAALKDVERKFRSRKQQLLRIDGKPDEVTGLVARSEAMAKLLELARRAAKVDATVLVTGESGVGKERMARLIHEESGRASGPFVAINCGALTETLLESELFGHAKGSFTGAVADRAGLFEAANGGTLFLDEIGEVTPAMQVKLLRVLQEREVRRVGENKTRHVDVRVVTATNKNLADEVAAGRFRQDLYYRLKVIELRVPALRDRKEDVLALARVLLTEAGERLGRKTSGLTPRAADQLQRYRSTGNVRELQNALERAVALAASPRIDVDDLPEEIRAALPGSFEPGNIRSLEEIEKEYILAVLQANDGNRSRTAEQLAIGPATLFRKLKAWGETDKRASS